MIVGIDWARDKHDVEWMANDGQRLKQLTLAHTADDLRLLAQTIASDEPDPKNVRVAIELHDGALLAWLLDQGYVVYGINPKSADRARDRYDPSGSKSDRRDAFVLADMLRTDAGHLKPIRPTSHTTERLQAFVRLRNQYVQEKTSHIHRLRSLLDEWSPVLSKLCDDLNRQWQRDLIARFPLHQELAAAHGNTVRAFCKKHDRLQENACQRIHEARRATPMPIPEPRLPAIRMQILYLIEMVNRLDQQIAVVEKQLQPIVSNHPDAAIFQSLPCKGISTVATLMSALGEDRGQPIAWSQLAARWGVAPVTIASGKTRWVRQRKGCNHTIQPLYDEAFHQQRRAQRMRAAASSNSLDHHHGDRWKPCPSP